MGIQDQVAAASAFIADPGKILDGHQPHWIYAGGYKDWQLTWPITQADGSTRAHIKLRVKYAERYRMSVNLIFRRQPLARLDSAPDDECKPNHPAAREHGLPAQVCGLHLHPWELNHPVIVSTGAWELPVREPVDEGIQTLETMLRWLCERYLITVTDHSGALEMPPTNLLDA